MHSQSSTDANQYVVVANCERAQIKQRVVIRTKAENVGFVVWTVVRSANWADMGALSIWASGTLQANVTDLTCVIVQRLDCPGRVGIANNPGDCCSCPLGAWERG